MRKLDEGRSKAGITGARLCCVLGLKARSRCYPADAGVKIAEERAAETRRAFEADAEKLIRCALAQRKAPVCSLLTRLAACSEHVVEPSDEDASFDFAPSERPWRDVMCARAQRSAARAGEPCPSPNTG